MKLDHFEELSFNNLELSQKEKIYLYRYLKEFFKDYKNLYSLILRLYSFDNLTKDEIEKVE